jgi:hypothetical protein
MLKNKFSFLILLSLLVSPFIHSTNPKKEDKDVELVSKDKQKFKIKWKIAELSGLLKDMLEETEDDEEMPSIPVPNIEGKNLKDIIELLEKSKKTKDKKPSEQKDVLVSFLENHRKGWNLKKLIALLKGANYLNIPVIIKAITYTIAKRAKEDQNYKITKDSIKKLPSDLLFEIEAQWIAQFHTIPIGLFSNNVIEDLQNTKKYKEFIDNMENKNLFTVIFYKKERIIMIK